MVKRSEAVAFAPGALVFPGGRVDPADQALSGDRDDGAARVAAIRETLEECAIAAGLSPMPSPEAALALQRALLGNNDFAALLAADRLSLDLRALIPFARWVPAHEVSRRFDTLFFVARAPDGDLTPHVGSSECQSATWLSASAALEQSERGEAKLIYPTLKNLERLAQFDSFDAIVADARRHPILPVVATLEWRDGEEIVRIPDGLGYPVTADPLLGVSRG
jgi:8-oxo-dGTP pyrophosphatase MutT (NUDIX family)